MTAFSVMLTEGKWENSSWGNKGQICFEVENNSEYVLESIQVRIFVKPKPADEGFPRRPRNPEAVRRGLARQKKTQSLLRKRTKSISRRCDVELRHFIR